ncbi:MAG: LytR/AlgR family response regulator transcription factor [Bacteroidia bacterium]
MSNNQIRIMLVEDEPLNVRKIKAMLKSIGHELVGVVDNAKDGLALFEEAKPDLLLVDIVIKGSKDGVQFAKELTKKQPVPVIFITSLQDYESFSRAKETEPYGFLNKPFNENALLTAIEIAIQQFARKVESESEEQQAPTPLIRDSFFLKIGNKLVKIPISSIRWIEVKDDYCTIFSDGKRYNAKISLKEFNGKLPDSDFVRVHRNYIINAQFITNIDISQYTLSIDEMEVPITRTYKDDLLKRLNML